LAVEEELTVMTRVEGRTRSSGSVALRNSRARHHNGASGNGAAFLWRSESPSTDLAIPGLIPLLPDQIAANTTIIAICRVDGFRRFPQLSYLIRLLGSNQIHSQSVKSCLHHSLTHSQHPLLLTSITDLTFINFPRNIQHVAISTQPSFPSSHQLSRLKSNSFSNLQTLLASFADLSVSITETDGEIYKHVHFLVFTFTVLSQA
jgi:hypothetical protein